MRFLHLPDTHIQPELNAPEGVAACLKHVQTLDVKPAFMIKAGDIIMDSMGADAERTKVQWDVWKKTLKENWTGPVKYCIGDHDCWGINKERSKLTGNEPLYGKKMACEVLELPKTYYSWDQAGWHFVVLDSIFTPEDAVYEGRIDDAQWEWFVNDLAKVDPKTPIVVHTHIPILTAAASLPRGGGPRPGTTAGVAGTAAASGTGPNAPIANPVTPAGGGAQSVAGGATPATPPRRRGLPEGMKGTYISPNNAHLDAAKFKDLFVKHPNVKLCLSGHLHVRERLEYNGVTYISNGAVCASNWRGDRDQTKPGYGIVDLYDDGTFDERYINFGWKWPETPAAAS
ncbi:MAG: metallophosphoesterase [Pirellulales bacterium]